MAAAAVIAALAVLLAVLLAPQGTGGRPLQALVHDGDGNVQVLDLSEDRTIVVSTSLGTNTVVVEDGAVRIADADCPNRDCTRQRAISEPGQQLICLPHRLWVEVVVQGSEGGEMDEAAVSAEDGDGAGVDLVAR